MTGRRRKAAQFSMISLEPAVRLWILRVLISLEGHRVFVSRNGYESDLLAETLGISHFLNEDHELNCRRVLTEIRAMHRKAEDQDADTGVSELLRGNVAKLAQALNLTDAECRVLEFSIILHNEKLLHEATSFLGDLSSAKVIEAIGTILDLPDADIRAAFRRDGILAQSGLVTLDHRSDMEIRSKLDILSGDFAELMRMTLEVDPLELLRSVITVAPAPGLDFGDFEHIQSSLKILVPYLRQAVTTARVGVNFLIYGAPGVGKTQLARMIAREVGLTAFEVATEDDDGDPIAGARRLRAFRAAQSFCGQQQGLIIFDEVEDVFADGDEDHGRRGSAQLRKGWLNRMLEENPVPAVWLSNSLAGFDPAFIRRFDMVIELPVPAKAQRRKIIESYCGTLISEAEVNRWAESENLTPAVVAKAASVVRMIGEGLGEGGRAGAVEQLISNAMAAQGHGRLPDANTIDRLPDVYAPGYLNADVDLEAVAAGIATHRSARLLLSGPPGTGKTAYGHWLAQKLSMPILVKKASDLMSKWVGGNERNIAAAFEQARTDKALLLIDEIDSFIQDRRDAARGWEITMVNEWLTQLEAFGGVFVASTNLIDGIDQAALRRFDLKVGFSAMKPEQAIALFGSHCATLGVPEPDAALIRRIGQMSILTPGDFAAVLRQHRFRPIGSTVQFVEALEREVGYKAGSRTGIGFL